MLIKNIYRLNKIEYLIAIKAAFTLLTLGVINPTENSKQLLIEVKIKLSIIASF